MKIFAGDIETLKAMFLFTAYIPETDEWVEFEISSYRNDIDVMMEWISEHTEWYWVSYNGLRFDAQVVEWMYRNYHNWHEMSSVDIVRMIYQKAQDIIDDANYELFPEFREEQLSIRQIDLFTIWHFNNENRRVSLKALEFAMDMENIEEMPIHHSVEFLTEKQIVEIRNYCRNDVLATFSHYKYTIGDTEHSLYKGENKIEDRLNMQEEFGLPCLNWDDVKIGAEWNKLDYIRLTKAKEADLKPKEIIHFYGKKFRTFFPKWVKFQSKELKSFVNDFGETYAKNEKQEFRFDFSKIDNSSTLVATLAKGGIHSNEIGRFIEPKDDEIYYQVDVGSQYPNAIRKYKVEPKHLKGWNSLIVSKIDRRLSYKRMYKETKIPKYNSLQKMGKLSLNGGSYGRLNTKGDWQQYPYGMLQVTIGGQLEILMIVEDLILKGFNIISLNTDGFDAVIKRNREKEFKDILTEWEKVIGNDVLGNFEYTEFKWIAQTSVNDYLALKADGEYKCKGDFEIDKELHKNKSKRIIPIALKEYFINNIPIEDTIASHTNIYDFCILQKASKDFHYEGVDKASGERFVYNKLIRYYVAKSGLKLFKIKNPTCTTNAPKSAQIEAGNWVCHVCNFLPKDNPMDNIDYSYYIEKANEIIQKIEQGRKKPIKQKDINQLSLF